MPYTRKVPVLDARVIWRRLSADRTAYPPRIAETMVRATTP
jgi:hypothetical protein